MKSTAAYYQALFAEVEANIGTLSHKTATGIVGFSGGGPVSMIQVASEHAYITCELSQYPEQVASSEGDQYELLCRMPLAESQVQALLTALGSLSMKVKLGHGHTVDVSGIDAAPGLSIVSLRHFSSVVIEGERCGVYEVVP